MINYSPTQPTGVETPTTFRDKVAKTAAYHRKRLTRQARAAWWGLWRPWLRRPVFIIGCSRAGTTVVYKTFSAHPELGSLNRETHDFWVELHPLQEKGYTTHALGPDDASDRDRDIVSRYFFAHTGRLQIVDKNNQNGLCVSYLHTLFPDAHFVYVKRSPGDNLHSLIEGWGKPAQFATWSEDLPERIAIEDGRYTRWCFFLAEGWREYVNAKIEEVCAFQYIAINRSILEARDTVPATQWAEIRYEDLVRDPVDTFRAVFLSAGLQFTPSLENYCAHVLETPFNAFSEIRLDKWKSQHNRARIERVMPEVSAVAQRMGYQIE